MGFYNLVSTAFIVSLVFAQPGNCKVGDGVTSNNFIQRKGTQFILNGKPHYVNGFNAFWFLYMASDPSTKSKVTSTFQQASQHGLNLARTNAFSDGVYRALQKSPGSYEESVFRVLYLNSLSSKFLLGQYHGPAINLIFKIFRNMHLCVKINL